MIWCLTVLCACGSGTHLSNRSHQEIRTAQTRIRWTRPGPITVHEVDNEGTFHRDKDYTGATDTSAPPPTEAGTVHHSSPVQGSTQGSDETLNADVIEAKPGSYHGYGLPKPSYPGSTTQSVVTATHSPADSDMARSERPMNKLAVAAFIGCMIGLIGGIFLPALWTLVLVGFVLGIIALIQIGHRNERGRGFAIAAIVILVAWFILILLVLGNGV